MNNTTSKDDAYFIAREEQMTVIMQEMLNTYKSKNKDYNNSFGQSIDRFGMSSVLVRLYDKFMRAEQLLTSDSCNVKDESIRDTLLDLATYAIMTIIEKDLKGDA